MTSAPTPGTTTSGWPTCPTRTVASRGFAFAPRPACSRPSLTVPAIVERARSGEAHARQVLDETGEYLGRGLAMVIKAVQPSCIYMSGEITEGWELVEPGARRVLPEPENRLVRHYLQGEPT